MRTAHWARCGVAALLLAAAAMAHAATTPPDTNPLNLTPSVRQAFTAFYNMNYSLALERFHAVADQHPDSATATDYLLYTTVTQELNRLDLLDTTFYANDGFLTGKHTVREDPAVTAQVNTLVARAVDQANDELARDSKDADALFARAWARALQAAYEALVQRSFSSALRLANSAKNDDEDVLKLAPGYADADLVVGNYQYVIGALPFAFRLFIGIAGISGSKTKGMAMLETAAGQGVLNSVDARTCMMLFLRREGRYAEATKVAAGLAAEYPRNYLFQLELANLEKDGGRGQEAIAEYRRVLKEAGQPGVFHNAHLELAYYGLGDTLRGEKDYAQAAAAFRTGAYLPTTSNQLKQRCLLAAGMAEDVLGARAQAVADYQASADAGSDSDGGAAARKYLSKPYRDK